jgi:hypothetical protein
MLFPPLLVPPSESRFDTWYWVFGFARDCAPICAGTRASPQQIAITRIDGGQIAFRNLKRIDVCCIVFMEVIFGTGVSD